MKGRWVDYVFSRGGMGGGKKERVNKGEYGEYILYPYMKIEE
jgi:hypothetical protein